MRRGAQITAEIIQLSAQGDGVAWVDEREVVLAGTVPGDIVDAVVTQKRKGRFEAVVEKVLVYGCKRVQACCPHFGICGGCRWQDLDYQDQLQLKTAIVQNALKSQGISQAPLKSILGSPNTFAYRNKMEFSFGMDREGKLLIGLHKRGRFNHVFDLESCCLQSTTANRVVDAVRQHALAQGLSVYNLRTHQGVLRFLVIRESKTTKEVMVNLVVSAYPCEAVLRLAEQVLREIPEITTWVITLHRGKAQAAIGEAEFVIHGQAKIVEHCAGIEYDISPQSFFQTHTLQAELLYHTVLELSGELAGLNVLDLYCGTGGISLPLACQARSVWGIEVVPQAIMNAQKNAWRNGLDNCTFLSGTVEHVLNSLEKRYFSLVVIDPPRAGVHKKALTALKMLRIPRIVYVSCNPVTLVADLGILGEAGYRPDIVQPIDMFPQTPHCEVVARLTLEST